MCCLTAGSYNIKNSFYHSFFLTNECFFFGGIAVATDSSGWKIFNVETIFSPHFGCKKKIFFFQKSLVLIYRGFGKNLFRRGKQFISSDDFFHSQSLFFAHHEIRSEEE